MADGGDFSVPDLSRSAVVQSSSGSCYLARRPAAVLSAQDSLGQSIWLCALDHRARRGTFDKTVYSHLSDNIVIYSRTPNPKHHQMFLDHSSALSQISPMDPPIKKVAR